MKRASLTQSEKVTLIERQQGFCSMCGCALGWVVHYDHWVPVALGNSDKPDSAMHPECHARKTKNDIKAIAKVKRLRGETGNGPKRKINSRGFDKTKRRKFDGTVEPRVSK